MRRSPAAAAPSTLAPLAAALAGLLSGCAAPPRATAGDGRSEGAFASSQVKPPSAGRAALAAPARSASRLAKQASYFADLSSGAASASEKPSRLGPSGAAVSAGARELRAAALAVLPLELSSGSTVVAETKRLSRGSDPVLHVYSLAEDSEVGFDDDSGEETGAARLSFTAPSSGAYVLLVRAYSTEDEGTCDLVVDGHVRLSGARFGGSALLIEPGRTASAVLLGDGLEGGAWPPTGRPSLDTVLLLVDPSTGRLLTVDDDSGPELGSTLSIAADRPSPSLLVVASYSASDEGAARIVVNDAADADTDGDGLGDGLERSICTCPSAKESACGFDCSKAATPQDTDGDGLGDAAELLGVDDQDFPQLLPRWGADPRHKDLFVEIDLASWTDATSSPSVYRYGRTLTTTDAHAAARPFAALTAMKNPDAKDGISLHLDLGHACGHGPLGIDGVCGRMCAYGPEGMQRCGPSAYTNPKAAIRAGLDRARRHLFHVALADCLVSGSAPASADYLEYDCDRFTALVHELGHNLGLAFHYGNPTVGGGNCKPNYPSLMNYAYSDRFYGGREVRFSTGALLGKGDLVPTDLDETAPYGGSGADVGWLATRPFYYDLYDCASPGKGCKVDFNRDGELDPSVRAYISPMPGYGYICENFHGNAMDSENLDGLHASSGPAAAELPQAGTGGALETALIVFAPATAASGEGTSSSGATLFMNRTFSAVSGKWEGWSALSGTFRKDTQPAAAVLGDGAASELYLFACADGASPIRYATIGTDGRASSFAAVPGQPASFSARDVGVARVGTELLLLARDDSSSGSDLVWASRASPSGELDPALVLVTAAKVPLRSLVTPALAEASNGRLYVVTADPDPPAGTGPEGRIHLYSAQVDGLSGKKLALDLEDEELAGLSFEDGVPSLEHVAWSRPAMAFVPHLDGDGAQLSGKRGYLSIWWVRGTRTRFLTTWGRLGSDETDFSLGRWFHYEAYGYTDAIAGSGPALVVRGGSRLAAFLSQSNLVPRLVRHVPHADGIPHGALASKITSRDFDDRPTLRAGLCPSLNWRCPSRCKRLTDACASDPGAGEEASSAEAPGARNAPGLEAAGSCDLPGPAAGWE